MDNRTCGHLANLAKGEWVKPILLFPKKFDIFVDIGAYCGSISILAKILNPDAEVLAIEPNIDVFNILQKNVSEMGIATHRLALNNGLRGTMSSKSISVRNTFVAGKKDDCNTCNSMTLADIVLKLTSFKNGKRLYIQMNCEGGESSVFEHEPSIEILSLVDVLVIECHGNDNIKSFLKLVEKRFCMSHVMTKLRTKNKRHANFSLISKKLANSPEK